MSHKKLTLAKEWVDRELEEMRSTRESLLELADEYPGASSTYRAVADMYHRRADQLNEISFLMYELIDAEEVELEALRAKWFGEGEDK